jgi:hypothetical protein
MAEGAFMRTRLVSSLATAVTLVAVSAAPASASRAYVLTQREGTTSSRLTLAPGGLRFEALAADGTRQIGLIIRYGDARLFLLDPANKQYDSVSLAKAASTYAAELKLGASGQPSADLGPLPNGPSAQAGSALSGLAPVQLQRQSKTTRIGSVRARAYLLKDGGVRQRLWYATAIPRPPASIVATLANATSGKAAGPLRNINRLEAGRTPLRIDEFSGGRWHVRLRTTKIKRVTVTKGLLKPPAGFTEHNLMDVPTKPAAHTRSVPADVTDCFALVFCGPTSENPDIWALYWGTQFPDHKDFVGAVNHSLRNMVGDVSADPNAAAFWQPLAQYDVGKGRFLGSTIINDDPVDSVGGANFVAISGLVLGSRYGSDAPNYWWRFSDHDPIYAVFVDQHEVDFSSWGGYHMFTPYEGGLFAYLMHPFMPWFIVKVPDVQAIPHSSSDPGWQSALDQTTERAAHEFVEAATDPIPFTGWGDGSKTPLSENSEIGDICQSDSGIWASHARVLGHDQFGSRGTALSTYWSNSDGACVPESRPKAAISSPSSGGTYAYHSHVTLIADVKDLWDDPINEANIRWTSDNVPIGTGRILDADTVKLGVGSHDIRFIATNSAGGMGYAGPIKVNVTVSNPTVRIDAPANGATFGSDQTITYRGFAFDGFDTNVPANAVWSVDGATVGTGAEMLQYKITTPGDHGVRLKATNADGGSASASIVVHVQPPAGNPSVQITAPANNSFSDGSGPVTFTASATPNGGTISDPSYAWTDDKDGALGSGQSISKTLSGGACFVVEHHTTVTVTDSLGHSASDMITHSVGYFC